jgi:hypothetical protein
MAEAVSSAAAMRFATAAVESRHDIGMRSPLRRVGAPVIGNILLGIGFADPSDGCAGG